jgi:hypothetical protein
VRAICLHWVGLQEGKAISLFTLSHLFDVGGGGTSKGRARLPSWGGVLYPNRESIVLPLLSLQIQFLLTLATAEMTRFQKMTFMTVNDLNVI